MTKINNTAKPGNQKTSVIFNVVVHTSQHLFFKLKGLAEATHVAWDTFTILSRKTVANLEETILLDRKMYISLPSTRRKTYNFTLSCVLKLIHYSSININ